MEFEIRKVFEVSKQENDFKYGSESKDCTILFDIMKYNVFVDA